jgi:SAM-dependent methyltransferase
MTFRKFWPLYLRAHRLPGTRGLHYFATAVGIMSAIEAIATSQPLIFGLGIAISYAIAIAAHWFVERNQPLITVSAFWGAVADVRMCWLALTGQVGREYARHGIAQPALPETGRLKGSGGGRYVRYALLGGSAAGLAAGLIDLSDLADPAELLAHPIIQLGAPIVAFTGALVAAQQYSRAVLGGVPSHAIPGAATPGADERLDRSPAGETSLHHACLAFLAFGLTAFVLAELSEHGLRDSIDPVDALAVLAILLCAGIAVFLRRSDAAVDGPRGDLSLGGSRGTAASSGPATRGLRVDGRVHLVDTMEALLSGGRRQAILRATLDAAALRPGERLLDVGCGTGELAMMAARIVSARSGSGEAIGIDATPGMIQIARRRAHETGSAARFELGVAEALPLADGMAQAVTSSFFFHHLPSEVKREAMREMWRVLAPGGRLVITDYGWARGIVGLTASFPMRFNFHEYVRGQLNGELERLIAFEGLGDPQVERAFLGYIRVLRIVKPHGDFSET